MNKKHDIKKWIKEIIKVRTIKIIKGVENKEMVKVFFLNKKKRNEGKGVERKI